MVHGGRSGSVMLSHPLLALSLSLPVLSGHGLPGRHVITRQAFGRPALSLSVSCCIMSHTWRIIVVCPPRPSRTVSRPVPVPVPVLPHLPFRHHPVLSPSPSLVPVPSPFFPVSRRAGRSFPAVPSAGHACRPPPRLTWRLRAGSYEPELHPGVTFRIKELKATLKVFSTGSITVTGEILYR